MNLFPVCPFQVLTGCLCPGCGATRAVLALLHGHMGEAYRLNALFCLVLLPGVVVYFAVCAWRGRWLALPPAAIYGFALVVAAFTIERNL